MVTVKQLLARYEAGTLPLQAVLTLALDGRRLTRGEQTELFRLVQFAKELDR